MNRPLFYLLCVCISALIGCQSRNAQPPQKPLTGKGRTVIEYRQRVNGYQVEAELIDINTDWPMAMSSALLHFSKDDGKCFTVFVDWFGDPSITAEVLLAHKGMRYVTDYEPADDPYLASNSPFYFADMDFDGRDELVIVEWLCGRGLANMYDVYAVEDYYADRITSPPFDYIEKNTTTFIPEKKQIVNFFANIWESERYVYERVGNLNEGYFYSYGSGFVLKSLEKSEK